MPILPEFNLPSEDDLRPFWAAIKNYSEASEAYRKKYDELQKTMDYDKVALHGDMLSLKEAKQDANKAMNEEKEAIQTNFPGLQLPCPAVYVGCIAGVENYRYRLSSVWKDYADKMWSEANRQEIEELRKILTGMPPCSVLDSGMIVWQRKPGDVFRIGKITHNGKRINAESLSTNKPAIFRPNMTKEFHEVVLEIAERIVALYASRKENRKRVVLENSC